MPGFICDENGDRRVFYAKGDDLSDPERVKPVFLEVRPGGAIVARSTPPQRISVAPDPVAPPSLADVEAARVRRSEDAREREREAIREEREALGYDDEAPASGTTSNGDDAADDAAAARAEREAEEEKARQSAAKRKPRARA